MANSWVCHDRTRTNEKKIPVSRLYGSNHLPASAADKKRVQRCMCTEAFYAIVKNYKLSFSPRSTFPAPVARKGSSLSSLQQPAISRPAHASYARACITPYSLHSTHTHTNTIEKRTSTLSSVSWCSQLSRASMPVFFFAANS